MADLEQCSICGRCSYTVSRHCGRAAALLNLVGISHLFQMGDWQVGSRGSTCERLRQWGHRTASPGSPGACRVGEQCCWRPATVMTFRGHSSCLGWGAFQLQEARL